MLEKNVQQNSEVIEKDELISIIVPAYNVESLVERCLYSLCVQTYQNIEIVVVDDGSTDKTGQVCRDYAKKDSRIVVVTQENGGLSAARNKGIQVAHGNYYMFVDSDDYINHNMTSILYSNLQEHEADIAMCDFVKIYEGEEDYKQLIFQNEAPGQIFLYESEQVMELLWTVGQQTVIACNKLFKKEVFENLYFPVGLVHEDEHLIHHLLDRCKRFVYDNRQLYYYLQRKEGSLTSVINWKNIHGSTLAFIDRICFFEKKQDEHHLYKSLERLTKYIVWKYKFLDKAEQKKELISMFRKYIFFYKKSEKACEKSYWLFYISPRLYYILKDRKNG